jgi:hypothetical protein
VSGPGEVTPYSLHTLGIDMDRMHEMKGLK